MRYLLALTVIFGSFPAFAQQRLDLQIFRPAVDSKGFITVNGSQGLGPGDVSFGLVTTWGHDVLRSRDTTVRDLLTPNLQAAVGVTRWLELGATLPLGVTGGTAGGVDFGQQGLGDLALHGKLRLLYDGSHPLGIALVTSVVLPTGDSARYLGEDQVIVQPQLAVDHAFGPSRRFRAGVNVGARIRPSERSAGDASSASEFLWGAGASFAVAPQRVDLVGELWGAAGASGQRNAPSEALAGVKLYLARASYFELGGGVALTGDSSYGGAAGGRLFVGFLYEPAVGDRDGDGIPDDVDRCPDDPEDRDGFQDEDGCPDPDNDGDGILDVDDRCPNDPETKNGFQDEDGCPDSFDPDRDGDGIPDRLDKCPDQAEDFDGFEDADGCPDPDNDHDGIVDVDDLCPTQPGPARNAGCPDTVRASHVTGVIQPLESIHFETDSDVIKSVSYPTLDAVADVLKHMPHLTEVEVQGHADERASDAHNLELTERRAQAVERYLIGRGVEPDRLRARGYGETRPLCREHNEACWARNRRVEFVIVREGFGKN